MEKHKSRNDRGDEEEPEEQPVEHFGNVLPLSRVVAGISRSLADAIVVLLRRAEVGRDAGARIARSGGGFGVDLPCPTQSEDHRASGVDPLHEYGVPRLLAARPVRLFRVVGARRFPPNGAFDGANADRASDVDEHDPRDPWRHGPVAHVVEVEHEHREYHRQGGDGHRARQVDAWNERDGE